MAGWNDLPKELKWIIIKYLMKELPYYGVEHYGRTSVYPLPNKIVTETMFMYQLLILLSLIDKKTRKLLQSKTLSPTNIVFSLTFKILE